MRYGPGSAWERHDDGGDPSVIVAFRRYTLLPLDDCLYALQPTIPYLTRSSLHRCLQRDGIGRLPNIEGDRPAKKKFKNYPIGYFHIDVAEVRTEQGMLHMFVAIDRTSKFAFVELHEKATTAVSRELLLRLIVAVPYKIHTVRSPTSMMCCSAQASMAFDVNSVPLSETIMPGLPRCSISMVSSRATRRSEIEVSGIAARHSRGGVIDDVHLSVLQKAGL
jgi:hypothetical protein